MPIYPGRRKGIWRVTAYANGAQREISVQGKEAQAWDAEARLRLELRAQPRRGQAPDRFSDFCVTTYAPHARATLGANTWRLSRCYIVDTLISFFGTSRIADIDAALVAQYVSVRLQTVKRSTVNVELDQLKSIRALAEQRGLVAQKFPIRHLRTDERRVHFWTPTEQAKVLRVCLRDDPELEPMLRFMIRTGVRKGEAIAATRAWLVKRGGQTVLGITPYDNWTTKSRRVRDVPMAAAHWREVQKRAGEVHLFPNAQGARFVKFPQQRFMDVVRAAGLRGGPHTTRHSFASAYLDAGGTLHDLSGLLGHSLTRVTEMYAHLLASHLDRARTVLESLDTDSGHRRRA